MYIVFGNFLLWFCAGGHKWTCKIREKRF